MRWMRESVACAERDKCQAKTSGRMQRAKARMKGGHMIKNVTCARMVRISRGSESMSSLNTQNLQQTRERSCVRVLRAINAEQIEAVGTCV